MLMNLGNLVVILTLILIKAFSHSKATTLRLKNGKEPPLTLAPEHHYHTFISHIWSTGQDQAAVLKRQLCLLLPTAKVLLAYPYGVSPTLPLPLPLNPTPAPTARP